MNKNFFVGSLGFPLSQGENVEIGLIHPEMQIKKANLKFVRPFNPNLQGGDEFGHMGTNFDQDPRNVSKFQHCLSYASCDKIIKNSLSNISLNIWYIVPGSIHSFV